MIELIEVPVYAREEGEGTYRKSLVILLPDFAIYNSVLALKSKELYTVPVSNKNWNLIKKFRKEGCKLVKTYLAIDPKRKYRQRIQLSLEEVIKLGQIHDSIYMVELRKVDKI